MKLFGDARNLTSAEQHLAFRVFGDSLPSWKLIFVSENLGLGDAPWTDDPMMFYMINIGPIAYPDCTSGKRIPGYGIVRDVFIHEMTHVWQYYHNYNVKTSSIAARVWEKLSDDDAYGYMLGKPWNSYNVEEQASIVEHWFQKGMSTTDAAFVYIDKIIRPGVDNGMFNFRNFLPPADLRGL